jgi:hypothetical protein
LISDLELLCLLLSPIYELTVRAQAQTTPTSGVVTPAVHAVIKTLKEESENPERKWPQGLKSCLASMLEGLEKRWGGLEYQPSEMVAAPLIDPRFKDLRLMR